MAADDSNNFLANFLSKIKLTGSLQPFNLALLEGFPFLIWTTQQEIYEDRERWYNGVPLQQSVKDATTGKEVETFPIKINPLKGTAQKHVSVLFGTAIESIRFATIPVRFTVDTTKNKNKTKAKTVQEALLNVFEQNNAGAMFVQNGILSQYLGGCVFWASWRPDLKQIEISAPSARQVLLIPDGNDFWSYREAWLVREITDVDAMGYGLTAEELVYSTYYYIEHWTKDHYTVQINNKVIIYGGEAMDAAHPFGFVPCVYIPHIREANTLLGSSIITETVKGLIREMNLRYADVGDSISDDSHTILAVRNVRGGLKPLRAPDGRQVVDLGSMTGIGTAEGNPDMLAVKTGSASEPMLRFSGDLYQLYRIEVNHPAVADGMDEGSQRSAATLTTRMFPLVSHSELERIFWTVGLTVFAKRLLSMMAEKGIFGITKELIADLRLIVEWTTMLPRDRETLVNEVAVRAANKVGSKRHLIDMLEDTTDPDAEIEEMRKEKDLDAKLTPPGGDGNTPPGNDGGKTPKKGTSPGSQVPVSK